MLAAVAILVVPYLLGNLLAQGLRMADYGWKIGLILVALSAGIVINYFGWPPRLGIDLSGGVKLLYELDLEKLQSVNNDELVKRLAAAANEAGGFTNSLKKAEVVPRGNQFEITLPTDDPETIKKVQAAVIGLNPRLSGEKDLGTTLAQDGAPRSEEKHQTLLVYTAKRAGAKIDLDPVIAAVSRRVNPGGQGEVAIRRAGSQQIEVIIPKVADSEVDWIKKKIATAGALEFRIVAETPPRNENDRLAIEAAKAQITNPTRDVSNGEEIVARWVDIDPKTRAENHSNWFTRDKDSQVLVLVDDYNVTGAYLAGEGSNIGQSGRPVVTFRFNSQGARRFGDLTGANKRDDTTGKPGAPLGIILDGVLQSAPEIHSRITDSGEISGSYTQTDVDHLVEILKAGSLPAALQKEPVSEEKISPELGQDTIQRAWLSMGVSTALVLLFMLLYYHFAGLVADFAVSFNILLVLAFMIVLHAPFTLAGLAGLVLSIGMAVDSNVLIYERMREERERGAAMRMVIRNGFGRAMATIIDTHSTTIITGLVLYTIGTEQLKGFAITLVLGLLVNLFTAVFCARVVFDVAERQRWITQLKMLKLFGDTHIDFVSFMKPAITASILISVAGIACAFMRGKELFDTDFNGGVEVQLVLNEPMNDADVRAQIDNPSQATALPDPTIVGVEFHGQPNLQYNVKTSNTDTKKVLDALTKLFGTKLRSYSVADLTDLHRIEATKLPEAPFSSPKSPGTGPEFKPFGPLPPEPKPTEPKAAEPKAAEPKKGTETKPAEPKSPAKGTDAKAPESKGTSGKTPDSKTPAAKGTDTKGTGPKGTDDNSSVSPPSRARFVSPLAKALTMLALFDGHALLAADPAPPSPSAKTAAPKAADTKPAPAKAPDAKASPAKPSGEPDKGSTKESDKHLFDEPSLAAESRTSDSAVSSFVGGTEVTLRFNEDIAHNDVEARLKEVLDPGAVFELSNPEYTPGSARAFKNWTLRLASPPDQARPQLEKFRQEVSTTPVFLGVSTISGRVAGDTQTKACYALVASILMIVVYIWIRFQNVIFGLGAVVALVHDVLVTVAALGISYYVAPYLGFLLIEPFKISLNVVAALLTICGYSISDTIVIFDRIREVRGKSPELTEEMINVSVNQTLSRTVLTVFTVLLVTLILYIAGGQAIHAFAFTMLIGLISGTYSSVYIAAPILLWMRGSKTMRATTRIE